MGAYGMALLSKEQYEANLDMEYTSTILDTEGIDNLKIKVHLLVVITAKIIVN